MSPKLILFTGAPEATSLKWDTSILLNEFIEPITSFLSSDTTPAKNPNHEQREQQQQSTHPQWRSLPLLGQPLKSSLIRNQDPHRLFTGYDSQSYQYSEHADRPSFFITSQIESYIASEHNSQSQPSLPTESFTSNNNNPQETAEELRSQFYEQSYSLHEAVLSSQIAPASASESVPHSNTATDSYTTDSFQTDSFRTESFDSLPQSVLNGVSNSSSIPIAGHLTNLKDIPNAPYLLSIHPQTMTVNLIVGLISVPEPRGIQTRRGAKVELVELLVGDETRAPFIVNFWLSSHPAAEEMKGILGGLRPRDIVLVKNVALSSFRGKVYGQSLRREMTKVWLLYRERVDRRDVGGCYTGRELDVGGEHGNGNGQAEKVRRVREWVSRFVGAGGGGGKRKRGGEEGGEEILPPDTQ